MADSDMAAVAEQLMQLSAEDNDSSNKNKKSKKMDIENDQNQSEVTSAKIKKEEDKSLRPKKRRYRSIDHIYMVTKPLNIIHGKKGNLRKKT
ncbi:hypothetical protein F0562_003742 [Nyssa sinensis]|uniref:Uncharacterized protein n=1 Tax=Nyssa sinensis TaxID=561372 RepID=A0A5J5BXN3_9ASTE|nr:hypothetical protein F0562_003742 [Nyssa sinensis]